MWVHAGLDVAGTELQVQLAVVSQPAGVFVDEPLKPLLQVELLRFGLAATGELQDVLDDQVHPLRLVLDDLRQASVRGIQFL